MNKHQARVEALGLVLVGIHDLLVEGLQPRYGANVGKVHEALEELGEQLAEEQTRLEEEQEAERMRRSERAIAIPKVEDINSFDPAERSR